jgi:parallel beta-helix repeat protein
LCNNNTFTSNSVNNNSDDGIFVDDYIVTGGDSDNNTFTSNTVNNNGGYGIRLRYSDNNTLTSNSANNNGGVFGICLSWSSNNTLTSNSANNNNAYGICLGGSNNMLTNNTANNNNYGCGISLGGSNNMLTSNSANNNDGDGIRLSGSNHVVTSNSANNNCGSGIKLESKCSSNSIENNVLVRDTTKGDSWSIYVHNSAENNIFKENTVGCNYPTKISFHDYHEGFKIRGVENPPEPPKPPEYLTKRQSISKYGEMENLSAETTLFLDFHYEDKDVEDIDEETLKVWKHNGTYPCTI